MWTEALIHRAPPACSGRPCKGGQSTLSWGRRGRQASGMWQIVVLWALTGPSPLSLPSLFHVKGLTLSVLTPSVDRPSDRGLPGLYYSPSSSRSLCVDQTCSHPGNLQTVVLFFYTATFLKWCCSVWRLLRTLPPTEGPQLLLQFTPPKYLTTGRVGTVEPVSHCTYRPIHLS